MNTEWYNYYSLKPIFMDAIHMQRVICLISVPTPENILNFYSYWALSSIPFHHKKIHIVIFLVYVSVPGFCFPFLLSCSSARYFHLTLCSSLWCQLSAPQQFTSFYCWTSFLMTHASRTTYLVTHALSSLKLDGELLISWTMSFYLSHKAYMAFMGAM